MSTMPMRFFKNLEFSNDKDKQHKYHRNQKKKHWLLSVIPTCDIFPEKMYYFKEIPALNVNMNINQFCFSWPRVEAGRPNYLTFLGNQKMDLSYLQVRRLFERKLVVLIQAYMEWNVKGRANGTRKNNVTNISPIRTEKTISITLLWCNHFKRR